MKLQQGASNIEIGLIDIGEEFRQRQEGRDSNRKIVDTEGLENSIKLRGLINPIIVSPKGDGRFQLEAGERRLTACRNLGHEKILARKVSELTEIDSEILELEENIQRKDLDWKDTATSVARIHLLHTKLDPDWTMVETGVLLGLQKGTVSMYMSVHAELDNQRVADAGTIREAYNMVKRRENRANGAALEELLTTPDPEPEEAEPELRPDLTPGQIEQAKALQELGQRIPQHLVLVKPKPPAQSVAPAPESILNESFLDWAPKYSGPKFNLIHCDFPYGVDLFSGSQGCGAELAAEGSEVGYKDTTEIYMQLVNCLCDNLDRVMSVSAHLMFWLSADWNIIAETIRHFNAKAPSLKFHKFPLIWIKSDNAGIASDPRYGPRHVYEACLFASRGARRIAKVKGDGYYSPSDRKLHPSTKPEPMLRHFMEMVVDETTIMLDPTCGSGASLRAAESLGAKHVLGLEIDKQYVDPARLALKQFRAAKAASREITL